MQVTGSRVRVAASHMRSMPSAALRVGSAVVSSAVSLAVCAGSPSTATSTSSYDVTCSFCPSDLDVIRLPLDMAMAVARVNLRGAQVTGQSTRAKKKKKKRKKKERRCVTVFACYSSSSSSSEKKKKKAGKYLEVMIR